MNKVYVLCHPHTQTGGAELVHQLVYKLNLLEPGFANAFTRIMTKADIQLPKLIKNIPVETMPLKLKKVQKILLYFPKLIPILLQIISPIPLCLWLSVDNFIGSIYKINKKENERINGLPIFQKMAVKILRRLGFIKKFDPFTKISFCGKC